MLDLADRPPPYAVPAMAEIAAMPWNGLTVASTFSGCGGSSLGYRMAGYRVAWASEFVLAAREAYLANAAPHTIVDDRDIREVQPDDVLTAIGMAAGELDLLDGSPPCSSFSTAGRREAGWGRSKKYSDTEQRTDDLFHEFARILCGIQPRTFVAENVSGLVKGTAKGYFLRILAELKGCGYQVNARLLDAQWLGVPQARQRLIFIGVRDDLHAQPVHPTPLPYRYSVRDALPQIIMQGDNGSFGAGAMRRTDQASPTIGSAVDKGNGRFPPSIVVAQGDNMGGFREGTLRAVDRPSPTISADPHSMSGGHRRPASEVLARVVHDTSGLFGAGDVTDRPCPAVTVGAHSLNSAHYQVHNDQAAAIDPETGKNLAIRRTGGRDTSLIARRLTLGELRRLCGFPDDFVLTGTYEQRWERLGRAVPPVMMAHIAATIRDRILWPTREQ